MKPAAGAVAKLKKAKKKWTTSLIVIIIINMHNLSGTKQSAAKKSNIISV